MPKTEETMAQQVAQAASASQQQRTGHAPGSTTVALNGKTLVVTLRGALTRAEQAVATTPAGAAKVQEYHRQLFASSSDALRREIKRITGVSVRGSTAETGPTTGTAADALASGTMVQAFLLDRNLSEETWNGRKPRPQP